MPIEDDRQRISSQRQGRLIGEQQTLDWETNSWTLSLTPLVQADDPIA
jgi:hypothetical protein